MGSGFAGARQFGRFSHDPEASDSDNDVRNEADLVGKTTLRRSKIFIAIGIQNCRELRRRDIFRFNAYASDVRPRYRSYGAHRYFGDAFYKDLAPPEPVFEEPSLYSKALKIG